MVVSIHEIASIMKQSAAGSGSGGSTVKVGTIRITVQKFVRLRYPKAHFLSIWTAVLMASLSALVMRCLKIGEHVLQMRLDHFGDLLDRWEATVRRSAMPSIPPPLAGCTRTMFPRSRAATPSEPTHAQF